MKLSWHDETPVAPVGASEQLPDAPKFPELGLEAKPTVPPGAAGLLLAVSVTVAVHVVAEPVATLPGAHDTVVEVASVTVTCALPDDVWCPASPP